MILEQNCGEQQWRSAQQNPPSAPPSGGLTECNLSDEVREMANLVNIFNSFPAKQDIGTYFAF